MTDNTQDEPKTVYIVIDQMTKISKQIATVNAYLGFWTVAVIVVVLFKLVFG